jgi:hypothetical protein
MAEQRSDDTPRRYDETTAPQNPPNIMLSKETRRAAVWSYFVPVVVLFLVVGVALVYWANQPRHRGTDADDRAEIGTTGRTDGGFDPKPKPNNTGDEIQFRADDLTPITDVKQMGDINTQTMTGRRVSMAEAEVDSVSGNTIWIRDGDAKFAVIASEGVGGLKPGTKISITGRIQADEKGAPQIRADRVQVKK